MTQDWSRLFSSTGFRWQMGLRSGDAAGFFAPTANHEDILRERGRLLDESPADYSALLDSGRSLLEEAARFAREAGALPANHADGSIEAMGRVLEPDFILLLPSAQGPVVVGGVVCFPSSWALPDKIGRTLHETHEPAPALNAQLGERIRTALDRLPAGVAWERDNWGLSRDGERNHHPKRGRKRLDQSVTPDEVWLRIERQVLYHLPETGGLLFGIRLEIIPWRELIQIVELVKGLRAGLATMPEDIAAYKGLSSARETILGWIAG